MKFEFDSLENLQIQLIDGDRGKNYPSQESFSKAGYCLFLSAKNVTKSGFDFSETIYIDKNRDELLRAGKLQREDIILTTRGTIGNVAFFSPAVPYENIRINSGMLIIRANQERWNPRFLYFLFNSNIVKDQIVALTSGSAVPQLPAKDIKKFQLPKIPKSIQNNIDEIIGNVTEKIHLNTQTNQTLESIAQAIFKSWFVDFDPVKAKIAVLNAGGTPDAAELAAMSAISGKDEAQLAQLKTQDADAYHQLAQTAALFPAVMQESELGEIPEGWKVKPLNDICTFSAGNAFKNEIQGLTEGKYPFIKVSDMNLTSNEVFILSANNYITEEIKNSIKPKIHNEGSIVFAKIGVALTTNRRRILVKNTVIDNNLMSAQPTKGVCSTYFLYLNLLNFDFNTIATGTALPYINVSDLKKLNINYPSKALLDSFENICTPLFKSLNNNCYVNINLSNLRDSLLTKLLSGEIDLETMENLQKDLTE